MEPVDFKALWQKQATPTADLQALQEKIDRMKRGKVRRILLTNLCLAATCVFIGWIWYYYQPELISTKIGIVLAIVAMVMFIVVQGSALPLYRKGNENQSNENYLADLLAIKQRERVIHTTVTNAYFALLTTGLCLYLYEYTLKMDWVGALISYVVTLVWVGINWFYFRPRQIRKDRSKINVMVGRLQQVKGQLGEERESN
ncbi:MAG: hypothetical protein ACOYXA_03860 [Bacteroidota bacterium]